MRWWQKRREKHPMVSCFHLVSGKGVARKKDKVNYRFGEDLTQLQEVVRRRAASSVFSVKIGLCIIF